MDKINEQIERISRKIAELEVQLSHTDANDFYNIDWLTWAQIFLEEERAELRKQEDDLQNPDYLRGYDDGLEDGRSVK